MKIKLDHMLVIRRLTGPFKAAYIRALIKSATFDEALAKQDARLAPEREKIARHKQQELLIELSLVESSMLRKLIV